MNDKPQKPIDRARAELAAVKAAEEVIRLALILLEQKTGRTIMEVTVDRHPSGPHVEIWLDDKQGE